MMDGSPHQPARKRRLEDEHQDLQELHQETGHSHQYAEECSNRLLEEAKSEAHLDIETVEPDELIEQGDHDHHDMGEVVEYPINRKIPRGRKRLPLPENEDGSRMRYYDRYKNQEYVKRNDISKYCQVCKKKVFGKLRSLPSEHRLRRIWILRLNLDVERSAELWCRDAFSDATHCGEVCSIHFPVGTENYKNRELLPLDMRQDPESYSPHEDELFDFESLELECVFCDTKAPLRNMIPFVRTRSRRYKWINALTPQCEADVRSLLADRLKNGASKFICDWHFGDEEFDINQYGEWRLRKEAMPNPNLTEGDKKSRRIYMVNHGETIMSRGLDGRRREEMMFGRKDYRYLAQKARRSTYANYYGYDGASYPYDGEDGEGDDSMIPVEPATEYMVEPVVERHHDADVAVGSSRCEAEFTGGGGEGEYSDDSDEETEAINKISQIGGEPLSTARFCQVCSRVVSSEKSMKDYRPRTWPFDQAKHEKWLEFMNWPRDFEESMRVLWSKRRTDFSSNGTYHFCPINVCQSHLDFRDLHTRMATWLQTYCVCCDDDLGDPNLLLPFPADRSDRLLWVHNLLSMPTVNKLHDKRWKWLRERLTRTKASRYRICVYHFAQDSFVEKDDCIEFNEAALPLPLGLPPYDVTARGPQGLIKCPLCDTWNVEEDLTEIRTPSSQAERILLVEMLNGEKPMMKKGVEQMCTHQCKICKSHLPDQIYDIYSVIAERKLVSQIDVQCIQCNNHDIGGNMVPFPMDEKRRHWLDALCRDHHIKSRLLKRLEVEGRHYLCTAHFHKNSLRYIPGMGVWKKFAYLPLAVTPAERDRLLRTAEQPYQPLLLAGLDDGESGIVQDLNYDDVLQLLGEAPATDQPFPEELRPSDQHPLYVVASRVVKGVSEAKDFASTSEVKPPRLEEQGSLGDDEDVEVEHVHTGDHDLTHDEHDLTHEGHVLTHEEHVLHHVTDDHGHTDGMHMDEVLEDHLADEDHVIDQGHLEQEHVIREHEAHMGHAHTIQEEHHMSHAHVLEDEEDEGSMPNIVDEVAYEEEVL